MADVQVYTTRRRCQWSQRQVTIPVTRYPTGILPASTITKSARKGRRWALEILRQWAAEKAAAEILGSEPKEVVV